MHAIERFRHPLAGLRGELGRPAYRMGNEAYNVDLGQRETKHIGETQKTATDAQQKAESAAQDQQKIQNLQQQLVQTQKTATDAQQKAQAASDKVQSVSPALNSALASATRNFSLVGDAEVQFADQHGHNAAGAGAASMGTHPTFFMADFAPIFLYRANDNVLFEAGFDTTLQNTDNGVHDAGSGSSFGLSFATIDYLFNDYVTLVAGDMLLPLGTYTERSAGFLNKFPDDPLARGVLPDNGFGAQLRGALPKVNCTFSTLVPIAVVTTTCAAPAAWAEISL